MVARAGRASPRRAGSVATAAVGHPGSVRHMLLALAALIAIAWQGLVVQTHVHPDADGWRAPGHALVQPGAASARGHQPAERPSHCVLCREKALSGNYVQPEPVVIRLPAAAFVVAAALVLPNLIDLKRSHAWRSRGPPPAP